jgi:hypothetical protein
VNGSPSARIPTASHAGRAANPPLEAGPKSLDGRLRESTVALARPTEIPQVRVQGRSHNFQGSCHPESIYPVKAPTAQFTRIPRWSPAVLRTLNTYNKCTGVCRFVRGIPVGISRRVADLWGFCGACRSP